jgi:hypothetical protein
VKISQLIEAYFTVKPPFAPTKEKKSEFPDAIALFSLEAFALEHDVRILVVSKDRGWVDFAERTDRIKVVSELSEALSIAQFHLQGEIEEENQQQFLANSEETVEKFISHIDSGADENLYIALCTLIEDQLKDGGVDANTSGIVDAELDDLVLEVKRASFIKNVSGKFSFMIVRAQPTAISISVDVEVELHANAHFSLYGYDSVDKDTFSLGTKPVSGQFLRELSVLLKLECELGKGALTIEGAEILDEVVPLDFGDVLPDWGPEHDA